MLWDMFMKAVLRGGERSLVIAFLYTWQCRGNDLRKAGWWPFFFTNGLSLRGSIVNYQRKPYILLKVHAFIPVMRPTFKRSRVLMLPICQLEQKILRTNRKSK